MSLGGIGACGYTKYRKFDSFYEERKISRKGKVFGKPIRYNIEVNFFKIKSIYCRHFPKKTNQYS